MPQMYPFDWFVLYLFFFFMFICFISMFYFMLDMCKKNVSFLMSNLIKLDINKNKVYKSKNYWKYIYWY